MTLNPRELNLIEELYNDDRIESIEQAAYVLATVKHETANTFKPLEEYGKGKGKTYGVADPVTGKTYYGRGYVQLTWKYNYDKMGRLLKIDLINNPELATDPGIAYEIMIIGMVNGLFTGRSLSDYLNPDKTDYYTARRIINGLDKANLIKSYALDYEAFLIQHWN